MKNSKTAGNRHVGNVGHHEKTNYRIHVGGEPRKGHGPSLQWMIDWNASPCHNYCVPYCSVLTRCGLLKKVLGVTENMLCSVKSSLVNGLIICVSKAVLWWSVSHFCKLLGTIIVAIWSWIFWYTASQKLNKVRLSLEGKHLAGFPADNKVLGRKAFWKMHILPWAWLPWHLKTHQIWYYGSKFYF